MSGMTSIKKKSSAFLAFQLHGFDAEDASDDDRSQQKQKKQQKKKARSKKKDSENATLKGLAMCAAAKKPKSKIAKSKQSPSAPQESLEHDEAEPQPEKPSTPQSDRSEEEVQPIPLQAKSKAQSSDQSNSTSNSTVVKSSKRKKLQPQKAEKHVASDAAQKKESTNATTEPSSGKDSPSTQPTTGADADTNGLEAVYSPTHITITRADGQQRRTVAVSEIMDQLLLYREQNAHLLLAQQQLNQIAKEQRTHDANLIAGLHNEINMFRQMCLNLQAENEHLKKQAAALSASTPSVAASPTVLTSASPIPSSGVSTSVSSAGPSVAAPRRAVPSRPPPGM